MGINKLLKIGAAICFAIAVVGLDVRISMVALGLLLYTLADLV